MKRIFCLFLHLVCFGLVLIGQNSSSEMIINENITVVSSVDLDFLQEKYTAKNRAVDTEEGYRIQVFYSNNRSDVYSKKAIAYQNFKSYTAYLVYDQPYYKLRLGDFETKLEALKDLEKILNVFPEAFVVNDQIKVR